MYMCSSQEQRTCGTTYCIGWKGKCLKGCRGCRVGEGGLGAYVVWSRHDDMEEPDDFTKVQWPYMYVYTYRHMVKTTRHHMYNEHATTRHYSRK